MPKITAQTAAVTPWCPLATAPKPPMTLSTTPGTTWWTCTPPGVMLRNGPFPALIIRVMNRVTAKVSTKAARARSNGSFPGSTMFTSNQ